MSASHDQRLRVGALVPYPVGIAPSQRFRLEQWQPHLAAEGIDLELLPFADAALRDLLYRPGAWGRKAAALSRASLRRLGSLPGLRRYNALVVHRAAFLSGPALLERLLALAARPVIYDFDDAIFRLHASDANRALAWLKFPGKTATLCRLSAHVVAGNGYLADYARRLNRRVTVVPTSVDTDRFRPVCRPPSPKIVVGWTGSSTSQTHLELFAPVLSELVARRSVELRVVSDRAPALPGVPHVWVPWTAEGEPAELARFDVGIMPMPDDEWSKGKCALKALLYMSMGIPTICSAVGANLEVIEDGVNGLLARTPADWLGAAERLCGDAAMRARLGAAGRRTVEERYSMQHSARTMAGVVRGEVQRVTRTEEGEVA
jgi:glycosyltransferase involved in cell wall biosynthesis